MFELVLEVMSKISKEYDEHDPEHQVIGKIGCWEKFVNSIAWHVKAKRRAVAGLSTWTVSSLNCTLGEWQETQTKDKRVLTRIFSRGASQVESLHHTFLISTNLNFR